jgi:multiple sugar transport system ATP-binding protein
VLLRDGKIEQAGSPLDLYERPATYFVAGFLGSPRMNFITAKLAGSRGRHSLQIDGGATLPVAHELSATTKQANVILGIRPQHISRAGGTVVRNGHARLTAKVELVQPTGSRAYITFPFGKTAVMAELDPHDVHKPGEMIELDFDMTRAVLIDPETERVI